MGVLLLLLMVAVVNPALQTANFAV